MVPRDLNLGGLVGLDLKVGGEVTNPKVVATLRLEQGRVWKFSRVGASIDFTLGDQQVDGTMNIRAPFSEMDGGFHLPVDPLAGGALNLRLAVQRLDLADALRGSGNEAGACGAIDRAATDHRQRRESQDRPDRQRT